MLLTGDYHTHTPYSHGENTVDENVAKAKELGLKEIAITDHGFSHIVYGLRRKEVPSYIAECKEAEKKYGVKVLVGIESNIRGVHTGTGDLTEKDYENFDIYLCGHHVYIRHEKLSERWSYGFGNALTHLFSLKSSDRLIKQNTTAYINAIKNNPIDAVTHLNYLCDANALEVAKCAADYGTYIELNSKKKHLTDEELCDIVAKTSARFIIDSDAHSAQRVGDTKLVDEQLARINFPMDRIDNIEGRYPSFRFAQFKKHL
ncbi:MAG: PHP domain-containing protein [Clostridia bacterium]|nr:PHP domain-containing protein [Clostridia bacterium]